ncbi:ArsR/SmtB family transcription factor [Vibrio mediterranei]|uniref:Transcriptional regulator n=1 Tax=Vibrio mediterranei TaxID=689 RepID=A0ABX5D6W6_9VIBR|nr:metalloregulator ArsR/SmtB family transcription factor [Vibrio mediterranei]MCG9629090.1 metalloregulator ArsR/SmtB family transcription factor [Vibrio mediterranei]NOH30570.1 helix-turn-helix transcriptional regulator [Vibrio mediterranei]PCD86041.1 transcriptional regulator [Vibrio mediterranei]PRQ65220.1 transcriptional regulator [Vibrio mediterranei]
MRAMQNDRIVETTVVDLMEMKSRVIDVADVLKTLSHPDRLFVLCQLVDGEQGAGQLQSNSNLSQSAFSQHLSVLKKAGLVEIRKEAQHVYYSLKDQRVAGLISQLHSLYCHG